MKYILYILAIIFLFAGAAWSQCFCPELITVTSADSTVKKYCAELHETITVPDGCGYDKYLDITLIEFPAPAEVCFGIQPYMVMSTIRVHLEDSIYTYNSYEVEEEVFIP